MPEQRSVDTPAMKPTVSRRVVLADYTAGRLTLAQIAQIHRVSPMTVYWWAQNAGFPHRRRGPQKKKDPTERGILVFGHLSLQEAVY
jgi:hypothetical protein